MMASFLGVTHRPTGVLHRVNAKGWSLRSDGQLVGRALCHGSVGLRHDDSVDTSTLKRCADCDAKADR